MGLEMAEFVIDLEEGFDIHITDEAVQAAQTVGDVVALVEYLLAQKRDQDVTARKRAVLAQVLQDQLGVDPEQVVGSADLECLIASLDRRAQWGRVRDALRDRGFLAPDPLTASRSGCLAVFGVWTGLICGAVVVGRTVGGIGGWIAGLAAGATVTILAIRVLVGPMARRFTSELRTVNGLAEAIVEMPGMPADPGAVPVSTEVQKKVIHLLAERVGMKPDEITPQSTFIEDLMMG
jgi:acyl carrier protein